MSNKSLSAYSTYAPWLAGTVFLSAGLYGCLADKVAAGSVLSTVGLLLWLIANLNKLQSFKGFGLEATTRNLEHATDAAKSTLADLEAVQASVAGLGQAMAEQKTAADEARANLEETLLALKKQLESTNSMATLAFMSGGGRSVR